MNGHPVHEKEGQPRSNRRGVITFWLSTLFFVCVKAPAAMMRPIVNP